MTVLAWISMGLMIVLAEAVLRASRRKDSRELQWVAFLMFLVTLGLFCLAAYLTFRSA